MDGAGCWVDGVGLPTDCVFAGSRSSWPPGAAGGRVGGFRWRRGRLAERRRLDGAATHQPGPRLSSDRFATVAKPASWRMRRPAAPRRSWRSHRSRQAARRERRFGPMALEMVLGTLRIWAGRALAARGPRPVWLAGSQPGCCRGLPGFLCGRWGGPVAGSFPMVMRSSPEGALVSDRRPGPGSGSRSTRLTAGGGVPGADRQGDRAMARRGRQGGLNAAPCFRRPRRGARRCAAAGRPVPG